MKFIQILLLAVLLSANCIGQTAKLVGTITDGSDDAPLFSVNIVIANTAVGTTSDFDGNYELKLEPGTHDIQYSYIGLKTQVITVTLNANETDTQNVVLVPDVNELDVFVVSGSKYKKKLGEEMVSMEFLKQDIIQNTNSRLEEALNKIPGFNLVGESPSIRGGSGYVNGASSRVLVLLDDLPLVSADNGAVRWEALPIENVEQIEVIKGASSALYGSSALNGIINVRTANPRNQPFTKVVMNYGFYQQPKNKDLSWNWDGRLPMFGRGSFVHMRRFKQFDIAMSADYKQDESYLQDNERKRARAYIKTRFFPKKLKNMTVGLNANLEHESGGNFFVWAGLDSLGYIPFTQTESQLRAVSLDPYVTLFDGKQNKHSLRTRFFNTLSENPLSDNELSNTNQYYADYSFLKQNERRKLNLTTGFTSVFTTTKSRQFGDKNSLNLSAYAQLDKKFFDRLTVAVGLRLEYFKVDTLESKQDLAFLGKIFGDDSSNFSTPVRPIFRAGLNYQLAKATFIRASFGQGYRFPNLAELFIDLQRSGIRVYANPELEAESGITAEVGIKQGFKVSGWQGFVDVSAFLMEYRDMIEFQLGQYGAPVPPSFGVGFQSNNVENARITGFEISSFGQGELFNIPFNYILGYTYINPVDLNYDPTDSTTSETSDFLKYRFQHSAKADISSTYKNFSLGISGIYNSFMKNIDGYLNTVLPIGVEEYRNENDHGEVVFDLRLGYNFSESAKVFFIVKNIFNNEYTLRPALLEAPRNYTFQVAYEF